MGDESQAEQPVKPKMDYDSYKDARADWQAVSTDQRKFLDQTNLTLAGGALGLSLTFLHDFVCVPREAWALSTGGIALLAAIVLTLVSVYASEHAIERYIRKLDEAADKNFVEESLGFLNGKYVNTAAAVTFWLNVLASLTLIAGIALIGYFAYNNLDSVHRNESSMQNSNCSTQGRGAVPITPAVARPPQQAPQGNPPQGTPKK